MRTFTIYTRLDLFFICGLFKKAFCSSDLSVEYYGSGNRVRNGLEGINFA